MSRRTVAACIVCALLAAVLAAARSKPARTPRCAPGRFLVPDGAALVVGGDTVPIDAIVVAETASGRLVSIDSGCRPAHAQLMTSRKGTNVRGRWRECGADRKVRLVARIDPDCSTMRGTVHAARVPPRKFVAFRSTCADDVLDTAGREQCNAHVPCPNQAPCVECQCGAVSTTTTPRTTTTSSTVTTTTSSTAPPTTQPVTTSTVTSTSGTTAPPTTTTITSTTTMSTSTTLPGTLPPDPGTVAPPPVPGELSGFAKATAFIRTSGIQTGADENAFEARRAGLVHGRVLDVAGMPVPGVVITVLYHPEFGQTLSRTDGRFDLTVNGGGSMTVRYDKGGFLPAQRTVEVPWTEFVVVPDVVLLQPSAVATMIQPGAGVVQEAAGEMMTDGDGTRRALLIVPPGTTAEMVLANGSTQALGQFHVRITEFTVGANGPAAMPAALPPSSGYTYAAEFSVDEAVAAGATAVNFNQPVIHYVENFLGFPVGMKVPVGSLDRTSSRWMPSPDGRVVKVVGITGVRADLDLTGDGVADDPASLGITDGERERVAMHYAVGQTLWRTPLPHFSPWDSNWPYGPDPNDLPPGNGPPLGDTKPKRGDPCRKRGSTIECQTQVLGEDIALAGTPLGLHYRSDRVRGRVAARTLLIPLSGNPVPPRVKRITLDVTVAGRRFEETFAPAPNLVHTFTWDGLDAYGRAVNGRQTAFVRIGYVFGVVYQTPDTFAATFGALSGVPIAGSMGRQEVTLYQDFQQVIGGLDARSVGLGGWSLSAHHLYDWHGRLYLGDGGVRDVASLNLNVKTLLGGGGGQPNLDPSTVNATAGPDGSIYLYDAQSPRVRRLTPQGTIVPFAGALTGGATYTGEGGPAIDAHLPSGSSNGMAVGPDGSVYFNTSSQVFRVGPDGLIHRFAGTGTPGFGGDEGPATAAQLKNATSVALGPDGSLYIADFENHRIRRVAPDGIIHTIAGDGSDDNTGDNGPARNAHIALPQSLAVGRDGTIWVVTRATLRRIGPDGIITTGALAVPPGHAFAVALGPDGLVYVVEPNAVRRVLANGSVERVYGAEDPFQLCIPALEGLCGEAGPALRAPASFLRSATFLPDGRMVVLDSYNSFLLRIVQSPLPGFAPGGLLVAAEDGSEAYVFDSDGRHVRTLDALTSAVRWEFGYDGAGRLVTATDGDNNVATIERMPDGTPSAIVAPGGQRTALALDPDGYLADVTAPGGRNYHFTYHGGAATGLLATTKDPRGAAHTFEYDPLGRLTSDDRPARGTTTLMRTETATGYTVALTDGAGLTTTYGVEQQPGGTERRTAVTPSGALTESLVRADGTQRVTYPDGTVVDLVEGPDPRWDMQAPLVTSLSVHPPVGAPVTRTFARTVALSTPMQPLSMTAQTDTITVGAAVATVAYTAATRTFVLTTPAARQMTVAVDALRRVTTEQSAGIAPLALTWDPHGRLEHVVQGVQDLLFEHDTKNRLFARTDKLGGRVEFGYDAADRRTSVKLPSLRTWAFGWDANDNLTQVLPPGASSHALAYDAADTLIGYTPPGNPAYVFPPDIAGRPDAVSLPGGRSEDLTYDTAGRPTGMSYDEAAVSISYATGDHTDRPDVITRTPVGGGTAQQYDRDWNGSLPTAARFVGPAAGAFTYQYDGNYRLQGITLVSAPDNVAVTYGYDADNLRTAIGPFTLTRDGPAGAPTMISDGTGVLAYGYDTLGRIASRKLTVNGVVVYEATVDFDAAGRIQMQTETDASGTHVFLYGWDDDGQLVQVKRDGFEVEAYGYDDRGNRTSRSVSGGPEQPVSYDGQDRLLTRGTVTYGLDAAGFLAQRGTDLFTYSAAGELLASTAGSAVTYGYDGLRRRVTRTTGGTTTQYLYGNPDDDVQVTAVRDPSGTLTVYHYDDGGRLIALQRGAARYYVATDATGSPRVVADATGTVVRRRRWDAFGVPLEDPTPAFHVALGFAGGLADPLTDLVRFGLRDYEPASGRWTSRDPLLFGGAQGNLYAYVGNHPVGVADPAGLGSVGVSVYDIIGVDTKLAWKPGEGFSACFGVGLGVGGTSVGFDPFGDLDEDGVTLEGGVKEQLGPAKLDFGFEISECAKLKTRNDLCVGIACANLDKLAEGRPETKLKAKPETLQPSDVLKSEQGAGLTAKVAGKICQQVKW